MPLQQFADGAARARWVAEKGLTVFSLQSPEHQATEVDLFVEPARRSGGRVVTTDRDERAWDGGWEGHSLAQLRRMARLPLWEKIAWLEEAQRLARHLGRRPGRGPSEAGGSPPPRP